MSVQVALNLVQAVSCIFVARSAGNFDHRNAELEIKSVNITTIAQVLCCLWATQHMLETVRLCISSNTVIEALSAVFKTCMPLLPIIVAVLVAVSKKFENESENEKILVMCEAEKQVEFVESSAQNPMIERTESTHIRPSITTDTEHTAELYTLNLPQRADAENKNIEILDTLSDDSLSESSVDSVVKSFVRSPRPRGDTDVRHEEERITRAKLEYIARTAHDLRTPLQTFHLSLELLRESGLTATQEDILHQAAVAADLMKLTVNQALDVETVLGGAKLVPHRSAVSISATLERVNNIINGFGRSVPITFEVIPGVVDSVFTDEEWMWQNLVSLLTNACKNTTTGSIQVVVSTLKQRSETLDLTVPSPRSPRSARTEESKGSQEGKSPSRALKSVLSTATVLSRIASAQSLSISTVAQQLRFEVFDTGVGIDSHKLTTMFDAFSQVHDSSQSTGTGLGLFGVRTRAEGLLGTCGARPNTESSTGTGTVVWFSVPYQPDTATETPKKKSPVSVADMFTADEPIDNIAQRVRDSKLVAMVVEDTLTIRKLMQRLLLKMGFARVDCYENGSKGLDAMMAEPVDIVFSDVQMPVMTGDEMVNKFRVFEEEALRSGARPNRQLVVAVTANGAEWGSLNQHGFDCVCPKPVATGELSRIIAGYLNTLEEV